MSSFAQAALRFVVRSVLGDAGSPAHRSSCTSEDGGGSPTFTQPCSPVGGLFVLLQDWRRFGWPLLLPWTLSGSFLLTAHMIQHLLIMFVAPPLILLGSPQNPLLRGLPRWAVRDAAGPFLTWRLLKRFGRAVTHPAFCWFAATLALIGWHIPAAYDLALISPDWHEFGARLPVWNVSALLVACCTALASIPRWPRLDQSPSTSYAET